MDNKPVPSPTAANSNIVATAMSTANVVSPDSPQISAVSMATEASPRLPMPSSSSPRPRSAGPPTLTKTDSMEVTEAATPPMRRQHSQEGGSPAQHTMEITTPSGGHFRNGDSDKPMVLVNEARSNSKDAPHVVTVTPPTPYHQAFSSENSRLAYHAERLDPSPSSSLPMTMLLPKDYKNEPHSELEKPNEDSSYQITCGNNKAEMVWKKFICPGINAKCVKCNGNWYTPKEFVNVAGKSTLKDWKRAIRINGQMLRKLIENGELNYYDHENNCSNQCRSNKSSSFDNSGEKPYNSFEGETHVMRSSASQSTVDGAPMRSNSEDLAFFNPKRATLMNLHKSQDSGGGNHGMPISGSLERSSSEDSGLAASPHLDGMIMREAIPSADKMQDLVSFWNGVVKSDLFDDIIHDVLSQISNLGGKTKQHNVVTPEDAATLTNLVNSLEMTPSILQKLSMHKQNMEKQAEESNHTIQELEKKLAEQKKYEQDLKRKSQVLDNVMLLTPTEKRQKRVINRFVRQKAVVDSRMPPGVMPGTSTSPLPQRLPESLMLGPAGNRLTQRDIWPQALQAASSGMARMNVSGCVASGLPAMPPMFFAQTANPADGFVTTSLSQAFIASQQQALHSSRDNTQSPKK